MTPTPWTYTSGPVTAYERPDRQGVVYLQWRATTGRGRNWARHSLGFTLRDPSGRLDRAKVREAEAAATDVLKELGGWADTQMPDRVYAEQGSDRARREARTLRATIRGETERDQ